MLDRPIGTPSNEESNSTAASTKHFDEYPDDSGSEFLDEDSPEPTPKPTHLPADCPTTTIVLDIGEMENNGTWENFFTEPQLRVLGDIGPTDPSPFEFAGYKRYQNKGLLGPPVKPVRFNTRSRELNMRTSHGDGLDGHPLISVGEEHDGMITRREKKVGIEIEVKPPNLEKIHNLRKIHGN